MGDIHINMPECVKKIAVAGDCPDCGKRTRFLTFCYEWYGSDCTCIRCGRSFNEDGWVPLPFVRGSREKEIASAKDRFRRTKAIGASAIIESNEAFSQ